MMASEGFLSVLVSIALVITAIAPVALLVMLVRDWKRGNLW
mgnify:FL=1